jgi:hypothetical protein
MAGFDERNTGKRRGGGIWEEKQRSNGPGSPFSFGCLPFEDGSIGIA